MDPTKSVPLKTWNLQKPRPSKTWETARCRKLIRRPHSIILLTQGICQEQTFKQVFQKKVIEAF